MGLIRPAKRKKETSFLVAGSKLKPSLELTQRRSCNSRRNWPHIWPQSHACLLAKGPAPPCLQKLEGIAWVVIWAESWIHTWANSTLIAHLHCSRLTRPGMSWLARKQTGSATDYKWLGKFPPHLKKVFLCRIHPVRLWIDGSDCPLVLLSVQMKSNESDYNTILAIKTQTDGIILRLWFSNLFTATVIWNEFLPMEC